MDAFSAYVSRLIDLHRLIRDGRDEGIAGESLRSEMDVFWRELSPEEVEICGRLSETLYLHKPKE